MSEYPNHPIAECYFPPTAQEFADLKEHIRVNGLQIPIVLYENKILCGIQRARICKELGVPPQYITPEIPDPISYVKGDNEKRRHWTKSQLAVVAEALANLQHGGDRKSIKSSEQRLDRATRKEVAKKLGASISTMDRVRIAKTKGGQHFVEAIKNGKVSADEAYNISRLPKEEQEVALAAAVARKRNRPTVRKTPKATKAPKLEWTTEEAARDKACLAIINAPSKFPKNATISQHSNHDEAGLRIAIGWLRENEGKIASFGQKQCDELLLRTNRLQAYKVNFAQKARPDGDIDPKLIDWAQDLWVRRERQEERLRLADKLRPQRKRSKQAALERKATRPFEERFRSFWILIEDPLGRLFRPGEYKILVKTFSNEVKEFFSNLGGNRDSADVADVQKLADPENS